MLWKLNLTNSDELYTITLIIIQQVNKRADFVHLLSLNTRVSESLGVTYLRFRVVKAEGDIL
jgi:hypothetical protein